ncbi:MAG: spore coat polysaccharide biosynthesis protein SpsF [Planctomycetota bacterium]|jgi:spore coat polysaccharide biosynthesis protein SpsF
MMTDGTTVGVVLSRFDSTRLPGKAMAEIGGIPLLERVIRRMKQTRFLDGVILATTTDESDDQLSDLGNALQVQVCRGSVNDVLGRVVKAIGASPCDSVVVAYGDNPLIDPQMVEVLVSFLQREKLDYVWMPGLPLGADIGVFSFDALQIADREATDPKDREHLNAYITKHPAKFRFGRMTPPVTIGKPNLRLTVDTEEDLELMRDVERELCRRNTPLDLPEVVALANDMPELFLVNADIQQKFATDEWQKMRSGEVLPKK